MASYRFLTTWLLDSPREPVWDAIFDQESWPQWWQGVRSAEELRAGAPDGVGTVSRLVWRSRLPYDLAFEVTTRTVHSPHLMIGDAVGELTGTGTWRLFEQEGVTAVLYDWDVHTTKAWMNVLTPVARPFFEWNHDWVMRRGGEGIAALLGCRLLAAG
ncbi:MAG: SRPBCC family protein [Solirubrobacterales bacterium]